MNTKSTTRYRPVLTAEQITHILALAKSDITKANQSRGSHWQQQEQLSYSILATLSPFAAKIEVAAITPAYTPVPDKLERLGGDDDLTPLERSNRA